jgi:hypothetical protein
MYPDGYRASLSSGLRGGAPFFGLWGVIAAILSFLTQPSSGGAKIIWWIINFLIFHLPSSSTYSTV